ncbi:hypothetical protein PUN28_013308 [Cardiocondyla obscurior]|uniref:Metallothionein n=1 Tax=Cardiocondyla obscurior TaxID=286306 RepID=A0AAW2F7W4_9HYME
MKCVEHRTSSAPLDRQTLKYSCNMHKEMNQSYNVRMSHCAAACGRRAACRCSCSPCTCGVPGASSPYITGKRQIFYITAVTYIVEDIWQPQAEPRESLSTIGNFI